MGFDMHHLIFDLTLFGLPLMVLVGIGCLLRCEGKYHKYLARTAVVFVIALALFFGGYLVLGFFGLAWRGLPAMILFGVVMICGWVGLWLTLVCFLNQEMWADTLLGFRWAAKGIVTFFTVMAFLGTLWLGLLITVLVYRNGERIVEYQGQTLVEVDHSFLDPDFYYYEYHGPLVRGKEQVLHEYTRIGKAID